MINISQNTLHDFCRACLKELKQDKCNIHRLDFEIRQWLQDVTANSISDTYSSNICLLCRDKLEELLKFRKMCIRSLKTFLDVLGKEKHRNKNAETAEATEEKIKIDQNKDWLEFDFVGPNETKIAICNKTEFDIEVFEVLEEPLISNTTCQLKKEPGQIEFFNSFPNKEEKCKVESNEAIEENEINSENYLALSGSEYAIKETDEKVYSDSDNNDSFQEINATKTTDRTKDNKHTKKKTKKPKDLTKCYNYKCNQCDRRCLNEQTLQNHMRTHQGLKPYQCTECSRSFKKSSNLRRHLEIHAEEKLNIICEYKGCGKQFQRSATYKSHYRLKHVPQRNPVDQTQPQHICEDCGNAYKNFASLKKHKFSHKPKDQYPFQCTICDKAFTTQYGFDEHQLRHAGIKNFECPYCGMKKTTKHELQMHINYHTKEKQWQCPRCPMIFNNSGNLQRHNQVIHQGIRRWSCRFCEESFAKKEALKHHEMRHTGEKPHVCSECGKSFIQKFALKTHMKTHNKYLAKNKFEHNLLGDKPKVLNVCSI